MLNGKIAFAITAVAVFIGNTCPAQTQDDELEKNWTEFLHYTVIGKPDLAKGYAQALLQSNPDPVRLLELSREEPKGYQILVRASKSPHQEELAGLAGQVIDIIEKGRFIRRTSPAIIAEEVRRLSGTERGWFIAVRRLRDAGEYAIPFMLDALADPTREDEWPDIVRALPKIGRSAIRPLAAALQTDNARVKSKIITALGAIGYPQGQPYLKYVIENEESDDHREDARKAMSRINPDSLQVPAAALFYQLGEKYYYHAESLAPTEDVDFANIWFWNEDAGKLTREEVADDYFHELMAMRCCEWALRADAGYGRAIGLWIASFFKAESKGVEKMPNYFGQGHADALVYATTAGVEYLHQALARAVTDRNAYVALGVIEALGTTAGEESLLYELGPSQPLLQALSFPDRMVRYSAAIALGNAGPTEPFAESPLVTTNLAEALTQGPDAAGAGENGWNAEIAESYALRAVETMLKLASTRNEVIDLSPARSALVEATKDDRSEIQILAGQTLAYLDSPGAQRATADMALDTGNSAEVRIAAFGSLATSAKLNANMLPENTVDAIYGLIGSTDTAPELRSAAAAAYGALNLPSRKAKDLILDQAKI